MWTTCLCQGSCALCRHDSAPVLCPRTRDKPIKHGGAQLIQRLRMFEDNVSCQSPWFPAEREKERARKRQRENCGKGKDMFPLCLVSDPECITAVPFAQIIWMLKIKARGLLVFVYFFCISSLPRLSAGRSLPHLVSPLFLVVSCFFSKREGGGLRLLLSGPLGTGKAGNAGKVGKAGNGPGTKKRTRNSEEVLR